MSDFRINRMSGMDYSPVAGVPQKRHEVAHVFSHTMSDEVGIAAAQSVSIAETSMGGNGLERDLGTQFEAMFLRQVLETMLPNKANHVFGNGTAGEIWRSMLAENLSIVLADSNLLGLSGSVAAPPRHRHENSSG